MRALVRLVLAALFAAAVVCVWNVARLPAPAAGGPGAAPLALDAAAAAARLGEAVRIPTISYQPGEPRDPKAWDALADLLAKRFPHVQAALTRETVGTHSLLYTWKGSDPAAKPMVLLAHQDVVPIDPVTAGQWQQPPFSGAIADGFVWGRGTIDDKGSLMGQMEAVELLLVQGFQPRRTVYLAFGQDEEVGGEHGAVQIAKLLAQRGVHAEFVLDEGGFIGQGLIDGVKRPVASVMNAEKGYASFRLTARDVGGHSSQPPRHTVIGRLARAVANLEQQQMQARLAAPTTEMLARLAPELPLARRLAIANRWLFGSMIVHQMEHTSVSNAMVRTTTAPTIFQAGLKDNVLPSEASAVVNFRILPGDSVSAIEEHIRQVADDPKIDVALEHFSSEPSAVSSTATPAFAALERSVHDVFPDAVVAPGLVIGATDARHYDAVRELRYNFLPLTLTPEDIHRFHGVNERIGVDAYGRLIRWYVRMLQNTAG